MKMMAHLVWGGSQLSSRGTEDLLQAEAESSHTLASVSAYLRCSLEIT